MQLQKIKSYAKINLSLNVIGLKKNKLHKIESICIFFRFTRYDLFEGY